MSTVLDRLRAAAPTLSVGMVTADLSALGREIGLLEAAGVQAVHFDVMDGVFCPMMTIGPPVVAAVRTPLVKDVHLMIEDPLDKLGAYVAAGADAITVHVESTRHPHQVLHALGGMTNANDPARGLIRGIALNPGTPIEALDPLLPLADLVLLLAVNPGYSGQQLDPRLGPRIEAVRQRTHSLDRPVLICADGGVKRDNIGRIAAMGPDLIVTGSAVFDGVAPRQNAEAMLAALG